MILHIPLNEIKPPWNEPARMEMLWQIGIDYATNTIDSCDRYDTDEFGNQTYVSIYCFNDIDIKMSNRWNTYELSAGPGGITITIIPTRKFEKQIKS